MDGNWIRKECTQWNLMQKLHNILQEWSNKLEHEAEAIVEHFLQFDGAGVDGRQDCKFSHQVHELLQESW